MLRRLAVTANAIGMATAGAGVVPGALVWPALAQAAADGGPTSGAGRIALDAGLCFGPLVVPVLLGLGGIALAAAWGRQPTATRLNGTAAVGWLVVGLGAGWLAVAV